MLRASHRDLHLQPRRSTRPPASCAGARQFARPGAPLQGACADSGGGDGERPAKRPGVRSREGARSYLLTLYWTSSSTSPPGSTSFTLPTPGASQITFSLAVVVRMRRSFTAVKVPAGTVTDSSIASTTQS